MSDFLTGNEAVVRLCGFAAVLLVMLSWERLAPLRRATVPQRGRLLANFGLVTLATVLLRLLLPAAAVSAALIAQAHGIGLFNRLRVPGWTAAAGSIVLLDLAVWAQHLALHKVPLLWRVHRVHHSDLFFDASTGVRFHPLEIVLSMLYKVVVVVALGAPPAAVIAFEMLLSASSLFTHGNIGLGGNADSRARWLLVTPNMHRVHHSILRQETDSNYGFLLSLWDRIFRTYRSREVRELAEMTVGIAGFREPAQQRLDRLLLQPLLRDDARQAVSEWRRKRQRIAPGRGFRAGCANGNGGREKQSPVDSVPDHNRPSGPCV